MRLFRSIIKGVCVALILLVALAALPFFVSAEKYHETIEQLVSQALDRQVVIRKIQYQLFPLPHLEGINVTISSNENKGEAIIGSINIWLDPRTLFTKKINIHRIHLNGVATNQQFIESYIDEWQAMTKNKSSAKENFVQLQNLSASAITLRTHANQRFGPFSFDTKFGGKHGFQKINVALEDRRLDVTLTPNQGSYNIRVYGYGLPPPLRKYTNINEFSFSGILTDSVFDITHFRVQAYEGVSEGNIVIDWSNNLYTVNGNMNIAALNLQRLNMQIKNNPVQGQLDAMIAFSAQHQDYHQLLVVASLEGSLILQKGKIYNEKKSVLKFDSITTQFTFNNKQIALSDIAISNDIGTIRAEKGFISWGNGWHIKTKIQSDKLALTPLIKNHVNKPAPSGMIRGSVELKLSAQEPENLFDNPEIIVNLLLEDAQLKNNLSVEKITLSAEYRDNKVNNAEIRINGFGGNAEIDNINFSWKDKWIVSADITTYQLHLKELIKPYSDEKIASGMLNAKLTINLKSNHFDQFIESATLTGNIAIQDGMIYNNNSPHTKSNKAEPHWFSFQDLETKILVKKNNLSLSNTKISSYSGHFYSELTRLSWKNQFRLTSDLTSEHINIEKLTQHWFDDQTITGSLSGTTNFNLTGENVAALFEEPSIMGKFYVQNGIFYKADLAKASTGRQSNNSNDEKTEFSELSGKIRVKNKNIRLTKLTIISPSISAEGHIKINENDVMEGKLHVGLRSTGGLMNVPLNISGSFSDPNVTPSGSAMLGAALGTSVVGPGLGTLLGLTTSKIFTGIGNLFSRTKKEDAEQERIDNAEFYSPH
ncbi:hypothetical protein MNBD_GAMMA16-423 [hydrothermal vent metagenome]|uniref:AsmA domain-containing protein n=1 Tax=hydrothermal vent metagenome TaxID=652676 RepID=A0A3B0Z344_9ZZZZ